MIKKIILFLLFILVPLVNANDINKDDLKKVKLQLQWKYQFQFAGFIMAKELGYYNDIGLDVELLEYKNSDISKQLENNEVDYFLQNNALLFKNKQLLNVKLIATYFQKSPLILITQPEIKSIKDLKGKKIMIGVNELLGSPLEIMLKYYNIDKSNSKFMQPSFNLDDFKYKKVDALSVFRTDQLFKLAKDGVVFNIEDPAEYGFVTNANNLFVSQEKSKYDKEEIKNFLLATKKGWEYSLSHIEEVAKLIYDKYKTTKSLEALIYEGNTTKDLMLTNIYDIGEINVEKISSIYKQLVRAKGIVYSNSFDNYILRTNLNKNIFTSEEYKYIDKKKTITICVDPNWKPFEWIDSDGHYRGMGADFFKKFSKVAGFETKLHKTSTWAETIKAIKNKQCDILPMAGITKERKEFLNFTQPFYRAPYVIATTDDKTFIEDISKKLDKKYAIVENSAIIDDLKRLYKGIKIVEVDNAVEGLTLVSNKEVFGFINITTAISYLIQQENFFNIKIAGKLPIGFKIAVATRKDEVVLANIFQKAVSNLDINDKEMIRDRWLSIIVEEKSDYTLIYILVSLLIVLVMAFFYRQIVLKRLNDSLAQKIEDKTSELRNLNLELEEKVKQRTRQLEYQAYYDVLTKLPNRVLFHDTLEKSVQKVNTNGEALALFFIDLDRFKHINDSLGHHIGDEVLKTVTLRLKSIIPKEYVLSRFCGDEFTIILESLKDKSEAEKLAKKILKVLEDPIEIQEYKLYVTTSIGISIYPKDDSNHENLLKNADAAMYKAKEEGRNNFQFYSSEMTEVFLDKIVMITNLRQAIKNEEFIVYYQPQIDTSTNKIIGLEALVRWMHPVDGIISPYKFIPIAEESGLIVDIDQLVMKQAMKQVSIWYKQNIFDGRLSLNLAAKQLENKECISILEQRLQEYEFEASWLELEITESDIMNKPEEAITKLEKIHSLGINIAIDDFGTGYSSLSYLKRFPIDKLKIDQSFVKHLPNDEEDVSIVRAVIALGNSLGLTLIAEGVETIEQKNFMIENSCVNIQGYFYAKPMDAKETEKYIKSF